MDTNWVPIQLRVKGVKLVMLMCNLHINFSELNLFSRSLNKKKEHGKGLTAKLSNA